jgi:hypothetical protein
MRKPFGRIGTFAVDDRTQRDRASADLVEPTQIASASINDINAV